MRPQPKFTNSAIVSWNSNRIKMLHERGYRLQLPMQFNFPVDWKESRVKWVWTALRGVSPRSSPLQWCKILSHILRPYSPENRVWVRQNPSARPYLLRNRVWTRSTPLVNWIVSGLGSTCISLKLIWYSYEKWLSAIAKGNKYKKILCEQNWLPQIITQVNLTIPVLQWRWVRN